MNVIVVTSSQRTWNYKQYLISKVYEKFCDVKLNKQILKLYQHIYNLIFMKKIKTNTPQTNALFYYIIF